MNNPTNQTSLWALTASAFFFVGLALVITQPDASVNNPITPLAYVASLCFLAFHLAMLPVITNLAAPTWAKAAGYAWIVVDNTIVVMTINGVANELTAAARLGVHIAAGTWVLCAALSQTNALAKGLGALAGIWLGGYSLVAPFVPPTMFYPAGILLLLWIATTGFLARPAPPAPAATPTQ